VNKVKGFIRGSPTRDCPKKRRFLVLAHLVKRDWPSDKHDFPIIPAHVKLNHDFFSRFLIYSIWHNIYF
jgi:hypothetical protein